jgi:hypothetical protein
MLHVVLVEHARRGGRESVMDHEAVLDLDDVEAGPPAHPVQRGLERGALVNEPLEASR